MRTFKQIKQLFAKAAKVSGRKTNNPVIIAMVGITGAGNSTLARALKRELGWAVIEKNKIRVVLREKGPGFTPQNTDEIHYAMLGKILKAGGNAILDSDFAEKTKRRKLEKFVRRHKAQILYLHLTCDMDVIFERMLRARYNPTTDIFASSAIAVREFARRLPWHYRWQESNGGEYHPRKFVIKFFAEVDTKRPAQWKKKIRAVSRHLKRF